MSNPAWDNLETLGKRLNRLIKYSETMLNKTDKDDHDGKSRYISNIVTLTRQQLEIIKLVDSYAEINAYFSAIKQDQLAIEKHNIREQKKSTQRAKQEMQNQLDREREDDKLLRKHNKEKSQELRL